MKITDLLDPRSISLDAAPTSKSETLDTAVELMAASGKLSDVEAFRKQVYAREEESTTGIGEGIAIPHGKSDSVTQVGIAIAKLDHEIEWETLDGKGVKLVFLFAVSNNHEYARNHMLLLADIARKLGNDEAVEKMLSAETIEDLKSVFA